MAAAISSHPAMQANQVPPLAPATLQRVEEVCVAVPGAGGIIGLFISDRGRINQTLQEYNRQGYTMTLRDRDVRINFAYWVMQMVCLCITLFLWCPMPTQYLFFRRAHG